MIGHSIGKIFSKLLLIAVLVFTAFLGSELFTTRYSVAAISQLEEAPGQIVDQTRQTLKDRHGNSWQAIAFKLMAKRLLNYV